MEVEGFQVNLKVLDSIVLDYAKQEGLLSSAALASESGPRELIDCIRAKLKRGLVEEAVLLTRASSSILEDEHLLFQLHKQQFLEHLRSGENEKAIHCARTLLEPLALNAYLEAYQDFKQVMLAFILGPDDTESPIAAQWSLRERSKLAGTVAGTLRASLTAYDPLLSLLLRYLISIQKRFLEMAGDIEASRRLQRVLDRVIQREKDPPLLPRSALDRAPDYKEKDVQDLAHAVELPRQSSVDSLRVANGNIVTALKNELSRLQVNRTILDELAREYCIYRGLVDFELASSSQPQAQQQRVEAESLSEKDRLHVVKAGANSSLDGSTGDPVEVADVHSRDCKTNGKASPCIESVSQVDAEARDPISPSREQMQTVDLEGPQTDNDGDVQMSDANDAQPNPETSETVKVCKFWRSRPEGFREIHEEALGLHLETLDTTEPSVSEAETSLTEAGPPLESTETEPMSAESSDEPSSSRPANEEGDQQSHCWQARSPQEYLQTSVLGTEELRKYQEVLRIRDMVSEGATGLAVKATENLIPDFFVDKPELLFQLKEVQFVRLLEAGELKQALRLARESLGPLAAKHRELLPALKATLLAFAKPGVHVPNSPPSQAVLATSLQEALAEAVGVPEPLLVVLMRSLLDAHEEWFEMQMCEDPFRSFFKLDALKSSEADIVEDVNPSTEGSDTPQTSGEQSAADESILTLMEFLAISRSDAIVLLDKFDGSVEAVFADKLGGD